MFIPCACRSCFKRHIPFFNVSWFSLSFCIFSLFLFFVITSERLFYESLCPFVHSVIFCYLCMLSSLIRMEAATGTSPNGLRVFKRQNYTTTPEISRIFNPNSPGKKQHFRCIFDLSMYKSNRMSVYVYVCLYQRISLTI